MSSDNRVAIAIYAMGFAIAINIGLAGNSIRNGLENATNACVALREPREAPETP
jgi:hypothetical protein